jgi:hypothetical protein
MIVDLLRCNGFVFVESKGVMFGEVEACNGCRLGVDLGVQAPELARVTLNCARVGGDLGSELVLHDAQFERVLIAHASAVGCYVIEECVHAVEFVWVWDGCGRWSLF